MIKITVSRLNQSSFPILAAFLIACFLLSASGARAQDAVSVPVKPSFEEWLEAVKTEAEQRGLDSEAVSKVLSDVEPNRRVIELDRRQPEFTQTFWAYLDRSVSADRIKKGRALLYEHRDLLSGIEKKYGVQGRFLVAFWGLETNFGQFLGGFSVINAIATLAYDDRRSEFFRAELFDALSVLDQGHIAPENMMGSWAGAMGQPQFMPSTFARYAVDEDGDGKKDIWASLPDVFGSASNYLSRLGWDNQYTWGREVTLPNAFDLELAARGAKHPLSYWQEIGVRRMDGRDLPEVDLQGAIVLPAGHKGPVFLVYSNFEAILNWNRSLLYAISVGHLADRLVGLGPLQSERVKEQPLSREQVTELQTGLNTLGHDAGEPDGQAGPRTRSAVRAFQRVSDLPADGYPDITVYDAVRMATEPNRAVP